ncbi:MAG: hypothetical protein ACRYG7_40775 [Janthinobacterium lividum]
MPAFLHVWQADLAAALPPWAAAETALSAAERARQARLPGAHPTPDLWPGARLSAGGT